MAIQLQVHRYRAILADKWEEEHRDFHYKRITRTQTKIGSLTLTWFDKHLVFEMRENEKLKLYRFILFLMTRVVPETAVTHGDDEGKTAYTTKKKYKSFSD
jgi:hypothetical protein